LSPSTIDLYKVTDMNDLIREI